jgi:ankyrin repeat protein
MKRIVLLLTACLLSAVNVYAEETFCDVVKEGSPSDVRKAIKNGADVNKKDQHGTTPLKLAVGYNKNPEVIQVLLDAGADVNAKDKLHVTALMSAAYQNEHPEVLELLLDAGADVKVESGKGMTAWDYIQGNEALVGTDAYLRLKELSN